MNSKIMFLWGLIIVLICSTLIILGNMQKDKTLIRLERNIKVATKEYIVNEKLEPKFNESTVVYIDELINKKYLKDDENIKEYCIKEVLFTKGILINEYEILKECDKELKNE
jgi:hypothetical protein